MVFNPNTKQFAPPQLSDLPEAEADAPASTDAIVTPAGRPKLHCTAVGCAPPPDEIEIGTDTIEHWNRINPKESPLQFELDFTDEAQWRRNVPVETEEEALV